MKLLLFVAFTIASERVDGAAPKAVWTYWNAGNKDHTIHFPGPWGDETPGDVPTFYAWPNAVAGSKPVHCYWNDAITEHDCHPGDPYPGEHNLTDIPFNVFWIMQDDGPFRVPLYVCFNDKAQDHTFHQLPAWPDEHCDQTVPNGYAYESWPTKITYIMDLLYSVEGGSSGHVSQEVKYSYGITSHESLSTSVSAKLAASMHAEVGGPIDVFTGKVSADVSASIDASISDTWSRSTSFNMSETKTIYIDLSKPCYIYRVNVEMTFSSGTVVAGSKALVQTTKPVSPPRVEKMVSIFGTANEVLV